MFAHFRIHNDSINKGDVSTNILLYQWEMFRQIFYYIEGQICEENGPWIKIEKTRSCIGGTRTPVSRVAGENSTTEPPMLDNL